jgi:RNA-directed DNA polymerase
VIASIKRFLWDRLRLKVNETQSQVARPSQRKFLGYTMTSHKNARLKVASKSTRRFRGKVRQILRRERGSNLRRLVAEELNPLLRGWANYFRLAQTNGVFEELDQWIRRKLLCIIWRQWKRPRTRMSKMLGLGLSPAKARAGAYNGYGPWWNSGQSQMNAALPQSYFHGIGLVSLLQTIQARA